jgi:hypothetical protein
MDMTMGLVLLLVTGFLWVVGAILHWHNIQKQEKLLDRMKRMSAPHGRGARRERGRLAVPRVATDGLRAAPLKR